MTNHRQTTQATQLHRLTKGYTLIPEVTSTTPPYKIQHTQFTLGLPKG